MQEANPSSKKRDSDPLLCGVRKGTHTLQLFCSLLANPRWVTAMTLREGLMAQILRWGSRNQEGNDLTLTTDLVPDLCTERFKTLIFTSQPVTRGQGQG